MSLVNTTGGKFLELPGRLNATKILPLVTCIKTPNEAPLWTEGIPIKATEVSPGLVVTSSLMLIIQRQLLFLPLI